MKEARKQETPEQRRGFIPEWTVTILMLLFGTGLLLQPFVVPTGSMESNILVGDHLFVDKLAYAPSSGLGRHLLPYREVERGDVIVFRWPPDISQDYVKRVIGVPGDRLRLVDKQVYRNGKKLDEPYVQHISAEMNPYRDNFPAEPNGYVYPRGLEMLRDNVVNGEVVVPPGNYFAMGDNRDNSADSRYWGFVPRDNIKGKPVLIWWSYDAPTAQLIDPNPLSPDHLLDLAQNFFVKTRWRRTFLLVRGYPGK